MRRAFLVGCGLVATCAAFAALAVRTVPVGERSDGHGPGPRLVAPWAEWSTHPAPPRHGWGANDDAPALDARTRDGDHLKLSLTAYGEADPKRAADALRQAVVQHATDALLTPGSRLEAWRAIVIAARAAAPGLTQARLSAIELIGADDARARERQLQSLDQRIGQAREEEARAADEAEAARQSVPQAVERARAEGQQRAAEGQAKLSLEIAELEGEAEAYAARRAGTTDARVRALLAEVEQAEAQVAARRDALTGAALARPAGRLFIALEAVRRLEPGSLKGKTLAEWRRHFLPEAP